MLFYDLRHTAVSLVLALGVPHHTWSGRASGTANLDKQAAALSQLSTAVTSGLRSTGEVNGGQAGHS